MTITCPACGTRFRIEDDRVSRPGVRVRCGRCEHRFFVDPPGMPHGEIASYFLKDCLLLDLETSVSGRIFEIGAVRGENSFERKGGFDLEEALAALDEFGRDARFILGHNILSHDLPILASVWRESRLLGLPAIDTLYLSPLAFPENPYHRLVKDYFDASWNATPTKDSPPTSWPSPWATLRAWTGRLSPTVARLFGFCTKWPKPG